MEKIHNINLIRLFNFSRKRRTIGVLCLSVLLLSTTLKGQSSDVLELPFSVGTIEAALQNAPMERTVTIQSSSSVISLPLPNGQTQTFRVVESPVMEQALAAQYSNIKSYLIEGDDDKAYHGRLSYTPNGISASFYTPEGIAFFEPNLNGANTYIAYYRSAFDYSDISCDHGVLAAAAANSNAVTTTLSNGTTLRTYRIALATTTDFYSTNGGTNAGANAKLNDILNATNTFYENEVAIRFTLIANNDVLHNNSSLDVNNRTSSAQTVISGLINDADYDLGEAMHVVASGGSGVAGLGVVCSSSQKARGWSGMSATSSISAWVNLFGHELGHQFNAAHTYYGTESSCQNRSAGNGYEPGSGTTVMSYSGVCGSQNITPEASFNYFHVHSLNQITTFASGTATCSSNSATSNNVPSVTVPSAITIPPSTPFYLKGSATDADGDNLTYCWEQYDTDNDAHAQNDPAGIPANAANIPTRPLFRSFDPSATGNERYFPQLSDVVGNTTTQGEILSTVGRTITMRLTARDNRSGGGGFEYQTVALTVDGNGSAFQVTAPNGGGTLTAGNSTTVTWGVGTTNNYCSTVDILLSIDGGYNYPYTLASGVTNNGSASVTIPSGAPNVSNARIMVRCGDNADAYFYDISDADFSVTSNCDVASSVICPSVGVTANQGDAATNLTLSNSFGNAVTSQNLDINSSSASGPLANATTSGGTTCQTPWGSERYAEFDFITTTSGTYSFSYTGNSAALSIFEATGYNSSAPCSSTFLGSNATAAISFSSSFSVSLNECTSYKLVVWNLNGNNGTRTISISGIGEIYPSGVAPANTSYTYVAVNNSNNQITAQSATSDFTSLAAGSYTIYGASYYSGAGPTPATVNPTSWVGQTMSAILSGGDCALFSTNNKSLTVNTSSGCGISNVNLASLACNNNNTTGTTADDYITFTLNPSGSGLGGSYNITVSSGTITPTTANYGSPTTFQLQSGSAGAGNVTITVTDGTDGACTTTATITDPGNCSTTCSYTANGLAAITCSDNGTVNNSADDFLTFTLNPTGTNLSGQYTVSVPSGTISPTTANYGSATTFTLQGGSAGAGNVTVTISDGTDGGCTTTASVTDPGNCSVCVADGVTITPTTAVSENVGSANLNLSLSPVYGNVISSIAGTIETTDPSSNLASEDNGGGTCRSFGNATRYDEYTIYVQTTGSYTFNRTGSSIMMNMYSAAYNSGSPCSNWIASNGNFTGSSVSISSTMTVTLTAGVMYRLVVSSFSSTSPTLPASYSISMSGGTVYDGPAPLSSPYSYTYVIVNSANNIVAFDANSDLSNSSTFPAGSYTVYGLSYDGTATLSTYVGGTLATLQTDLGNSTVCGDLSTNSVAVTINGNTCSLSASGLGNVACNDNNTNSDASDDYITFSLNPTGANIGTTYTVTISGGTITPTTGTYGSATNFQLQGGSAGGGNVTIVIIDGTDGSCSISESVTDPGSCSSTCTLSASGLGNVACNDNNTNSDASDDYITFSLNPTGTNIGTTYTVSVPSGTITPTTGNYGSATNFQLQGGSAGSGNVTVTITDGTSGGCTTTATVTDPGSCSSTCTLSASGLGNVTCNDNGTNSDASDDYITFSLNPTGANIGTTYTVSVPSGTISPTSGTYGAATTFQLQGGSAGSGNVTVTITDGTSSGCTTTASITDPGSCSPNCNITASGVASITCNDNNTNSDVSDDFVTFTLNPTGFNLGTTYTVSVPSGTISPTSGTYGAATTFTLQNGSAGAGDVTVTITDGTTGSCTTTETITDPGSCSPVCNLASAGLAGIVCNSNNTASNASDDFLSFSLNPTGANLGTTYNVSVSGGTVTPTSGTYGSQTVFRLQDGSAGGGNVTVTITDATSGSCMVTATVTDPGSCSNTCNLTSNGLGTITCSDNNTNSDASDDFVTFTLNPTGVNLASTYNVSVSGGTITPTSGTYGAATTFRLQDGSAGSGSTVTVTITDATSGSCTATATIADPGSCSNNCNITTTGLASIACNSNNTVSDVSDDFVTFSLNPTGANLGTTYNVSVSGGTISPTSGTYGAATTFQLQNGSAGAGNVTITITDATNTGCTTIATITDPGTCSNTCNLTSNGLGTITCNDNSTNSVASDDFVTFTLNPTGVNLASTYNVSVSGGTITPTSGTYGAATTFRLQDGSAGSGSTVTVTITDAASGSCTTTATITDPGSCSNTCNIATAGLTNVFCNANNTVSNASDDYITFSLNPTGANLGTTYNVSVSGGTVTPTSGTYGAITNFQLQAGSAGAGNVTLTITDATNTGCNTIATITDPGSCSNTCNLTASGIASVTCNDAGTVSNVNDDFISFTLNPTGVNLSGSYTVSVSSGTISPSSGNYNNATTFQLQGGSAGAGNVTLTITDATTGTCFFAETVIDPGSCSNTCDLSVTGITNVICNDAGTGGNAGDDFITFNLNPVGLNLGTTYNVSVSNGSVTPTSGTYGAATAFQLQAGSAGNGNVIVTVTDASSSGCTVATTVTDPGSCSNNCSLSSAGLANIACNNGGSNANLADDFITFDLNPTGNNTGSTYLVTVSNGTVTPTTGTYGAVTAFQLQAGSAGAGNVTITITDTNNGNCVTSALVTDPGRCSSSCDIVSTGTTNVTCNNAGTNTVPGDDYITFDLNPTGTFLTSTYTVSVSSGSITPTSGTYGAATTFQLQGGSAGAGNVTVTITDDFNVNCIATTTITDPGSCSNTCDISSVGMANVACNNNGTTINNTDDYITFDLNPVGSNLGSSYTVTVSSGTLVTNTGTYGAATTFQLQNGSAGGGNVTLTITDNTSGTCQTTALLTDPGNCSTTCDIADAGLSNINCNNNNTTTNSLDDYITFRLNPTGSNLGSSYTVSVSPGSLVSSNTGVYGNSTTFEMQGGSAGSGDVTVTITDNATGNCTETVTVVDPGNCSSLCNLTNAGLANIACNDGGTASDISDDFTTFELNPTGANLAGTYTVTASNGITITPTSGTYGSATTFQLQAGSAGINSNVLVTITDDVRPCSITATVTDPGTCSNTCQMADAGVTNVICNDNLTNTDPVDDYITFSLNPTGFNLNSFYTIAVTGGTLVSGNTGTYGSTTNFQLQNGSAGGGDITVVITNSADASCVLTTIITDPGSCSNTCDLTTADLTNVACNDAGTVSDASDDYITFDLNPTGVNIGSSYTVSTSSGTLVSNTGVYGSTTTFQLQAGSAGAGDVTVTVTDNGNSNCTATATITDPGSCSNTCALSDVVLRGIICNDAGTNSIDTDDYITFTLNPTGFNVGSKYLVTVPSGTVTPTSSTYGSVTTFRLQAGSAGAGDVIITVTDSINTSCMTTATVVDPGSCSNTCVLSDAGLASVMCNDAGTNSVATDDFISFSLNPTGLNIGTSYTVSVSSGTLSATSGVYGSATTFQLQNGSAGNGDVTVVITDNSGTNCQITATITDPGTCSNTCDITNVALGNVTCNDNSTVSDASDDYITFSMNPTGLNIGTSYTVSVSSGTVTPTSGTYGSMTMFQLQNGSAGAGDIVVTIVDDATGSCQATATVTDPGACSNVCDLTTAGLTSVACNDAGTNGDPNDDFVTFSLNPTGVNTGTSYTVSVSNGTITPTTGVYGSATTFQLQAGSAGAGDVVVTITDNTSGNCQTTATVTDPGVCSSTCNLLTTGLGNIDCNNNSTANNSFDDFLTFSLNPTGQNIGTSYTVSVSSGTITPTSGVYGNMTTFQLQAGSAGAGNVVVTITDNASGNCQTTATVTDPGSCSGLMEAVAVETQAVSCNGGANGAAQVTITNGTAPYTVNGQTYTSSPFIISGLSAGPASFTITDASSPTRTAIVSVTITQPATITATTSVTNLTCNDNNSGAIDLTVSGGTAPYTFAWSNNATSEDIGNLAAGTYTVTITDANGCTATASATVTEPSVITATTSVTNLVCNSDNNGAIDLTVSGGTAPYTFAWNNNNVTEDIGNLAAGTYTVTVTDANGCTATASTIVTEPNAITATTSVTNLACNGDNNGAIDLTVSGGTAPYTFAWNNNATSEDIGNLSGGTYTVVITDANGCTATASTTVTEPNAITATTSVTNLACNGDNSGAIDLTVSGGTAPYTFAWNNNATSEDIGNLSGGTYTVVITDANGCTTTASATVVEPTTIVATATTTALTCGNANNGAISLTVTGGTAPYTYAWSNNQTTANLSNLSVGTYTVTITDANNCTATASATITQAPAITLTTSATNITCNGAQDGAIDLQVTGGVSPYTYQWNTNATTEDITGLNVGTYIVTVTDANGCIAIGQANITQPAILTVNAVSGANYNNFDISCNGASDGAVNLTVAGGTAPYTYQWNNTQTTQNLSGVSAGTYSVVVTDANNCTATASISLIEPTLLVATATDMNLLCAGANNGTSTVTATGGTMPYTYAWSNGQSTQTATNLSAATYTVTITDANNCTTTASATITEPAALVVNVSITQAIACNGGTGDISSTVTGGTAPYTYDWSNGVAVADLVGVGAGTYTLIVTDANNCTTTQTITLSEPTMMMTSTVNTNISCNSLSDGAVDLTVTGGTAPYTFVWDNSQTTEDLTGLVAGTYTVTVTDANNCTVTTSTTITEPAALTATATAVDALCNGGNGSVNLNVSGGTQPYTFVWSNTATTADLLQVGTGTYTVTVTDANNCTTTATATVNEPTAISITSSVTDVSCNGGNDGTITATATGGTSPYTYDWGIGTFGQTLSGVAAGTYTITVTDANGCASTHTATVNEPTAITVTGVVTNVTCNGANDGAITTTVTGGTSPYTYTWSGATGGANLTNIGAGNYTVTVTDANNCTATASFQVTEPTLLTIAATTQGIACNGGTGSLNSLVSGGTVPYTIVWTDATGATVPNPSSVTVGTYTATVTDANNCTATAQVTLTEPTAIVISTLILEDVLCAGDATGSILINVTGGAGSFSYAWDTPQGVNNSANNLTAGNYNVTVTDFNGCTETANFTINEPTALTLSLTSADDPTTNQFAQATANVSGGVTPYTYQWDGGTGSQTTQTATNLKSGVYSVVVTDANGCTISGTIQVIPTSVENLTNVSKLNLFPNPTTNQATIELELGKAADVNIAIYNTAGIKLQEFGNEYTAQTRHQIDLSKYPAGVYLVSIVVDEAIITKRLVVIK